MISFKYIGIFVSLILGLCLVTNAQYNSFEVEQIAFSSSLNDEFSPMYFNKGLVFSSNAMSNASIKSEGGRLFNILYAEQKDSGNFKSPVLFSKELTTILNEGPVSFSPDGKTIYYARNNLIEGKFKDINSPSNTMGIYIAQLQNGLWGSVEAFPFNSDDYSIGTPAISPDGKRLYYASDMPGGNGGTDIFYSEYSNGKWQAPKNLGKVINTPGNESYPFVSAGGLLIFASDGHPGYGGKDIYYTGETNKVWQRPIHLGGDVNSESDDFGLITDINFTKGYFSSNRKHSQSIYTFKSIVPQFGYCDTLKRQPQCFQFFDDRFTDTLHLDYEWNFGKGIVKKGYQVEHCYEKSGDYEVLLTITHNLADSVFKTKAVHRFSIESNEEISINSNRLGVVDEPMEFSLALNTSSEYYEAETYWNFSEGYIEAPPSTKHIFTESGSKEVTIGFRGATDVYGITPKKCFVTQVKILSDYQRAAAVYIQEAEKESDIKIFSNHVIPNGKASSQYGILCSVLTEQLPMLKTDRIETVISRPSWRIDFEGGKMSSETRAYITEITQELVTLSNLRLIVAVHKGSKGSSKSNKEETVLIAQSIEDTFLEAGFPSDRLSCIAYGDERPIVGVKEKNANTMNQRIEFIVLDASEE